MLSKTLLTALVLVPSALCAPTRTTCHCRLVSGTDSTNTSPPSSIETPSTAHWTPANPISSTPASLSVCETLASQLEIFRHSDPELYDLYMRGANNRAEDPFLAQKPIPTSVLLEKSTKDNAAMHDYASSSTEDDNDDNEQKNTRIVCSSEPSSSSSQTQRPLSDFHSSPMALCALQLIVLFSVLACVIEGVNLLRKYIQTLLSPSPTTLSSPSSNKSLRLTGSEQRLLAIPPTNNNHYQDAICSPGAEKKLKAYEEAAPRTLWYVKSARREFIAYDDDSDDEVNRPVM